MAGIRIGNALVFIALVAIFIILLPSIDRLRQTQSPEGEKGEEAAAVAGGQKLFPPPSPAYERVHFNLDAKHIRDNVPPSGILGVDLDSMDKDHLVLTLHSYLDNSDAVCRRKLRMGNLGDKGWELCDDDDVAPRPPGIVYAFGVDTDFDFEKDVAKVYGCHVHSFDERRGEKDRDITPLVHFHNYGVDSEDYVTDRGYQMYTVNTIKQKLGHQNESIQLMMFNTEGSEWSALAHAISSGQLNGVKQLFVEFHIYDRPVENLRVRAKVLQKIEMLGYQKFYVHKNVNCGITVPGFPVERSRCLDVHYLLRP